MKAKQPKPVRAWGWMIQEGKSWLLCRWAEPTKDLLLATPKPSPEAAAVQVLIVRPVPKKARKK